MYRAIHFSFAIQVKHFYCCCIMTLSDSFYRTLYRIFYGTFMTYATNCFAVGDTGIFYSFGYVQIIILLNQNFILWPFWAVVFHYKFWNFLIIQVNIYSYEGIKILLSTSIVRIKQRYTIMENNRQSNTCVSLYSFLYKPNLS